MITQLLIDGKKGDIHDIPHSKVIYKTDRKGRAGSLEFTYVGGDVFTKKIEINNGDVVLFKKDGKNIFYGYVFKVSGEQEKKVLCYDQIRYLKNKDSFVCIDKRADEILQLIARINGLTVGKIENTGYVIPKTICDNKEYLDSIMKSLEKTLMATGKLCFIQDNAGKLELLDINQTRLDVVIDGDTLLTKYNHSKDIDGETYNKVKLIQDKTGEEVVVEDKGTQKKWGTLQYHDVMDKGLNKAQIQEQAQAILKLKNRERKSLKLDCIGNISCKAGYSPYVSLKEEGIEGYFLIDSATHTFLEI